MARESTVYNCNFFKKINSDGPFHVLEDCLHDSLYWSLNPELFLLKSQCICTLWIVFLTEAHDGKFIFSPFVNIFWLNNCFSINIIHSPVNSHGLHFSVPSHHHQSVQAWSTLFYLWTFWIASKEIFLRD